MNSDLEKRKWNGIILILVSVFVLLSIGVSAEGVFAASQEELRLFPLIEGAKKEGKMIFYGSIPIQKSTILLGKFQEKYPFIKAEHFRITSTQILPRMSMEYRGNRYIPDVIGTSAFPLYTVYKEGLLGKYESPERRAFSKELKDAEGYWTSWFVSFFAPAYNTRLIPTEQVPKDWDDLLDPKWKGKIGVAANQSDKWFLAMSHAVGKEKSISYMKRLSEQNTYYHVGGNLSVQLLGAKEFSIIHALTSYLVWDAKEAGAPVNWISTVKPIGVMPSLIGIASRPSHPNAAKLFIDFVLSKEGQGIMSQLFRIPAREDVETNPPGMRKGLELSVIDPKLGEEFKEYEEIQRMMFKKR